MTTGAATFSAVGVALYAAHHLGDYWVQTHHQALTKGKPRREGQLACAAHVATYTAVTSAFMVLVWVSFDLAITWYSLLLGQALSAVTHYWADRRAPLLRLADRLGKGEFARLGTPRVGHDDNITLGTGATALDQSWHWTWLFVAAYVTAVLG